MNTFKNIEELKGTFASGNFDFPESFSIGGENSNQHAEYKQHSVTDFGLEDIMHKGYKPMWIYTARANVDNQEVVKSLGLNAWIVLLWGMDNKHRILPFDVRSISRSRAIMTTHRDNVQEDYKEVSQDRVIPDKVRVMLLDLPMASELIGKVDTGADVCSLHAEDIEVHRSSQKVSFRCPPLSNNVITIPMVDQQAVQTPSAGTEYRPVVSLNIKVADKSLNDVRVNLKDRSEMEQPFLVGQNALEAGKFLIDPNIMKEDLDDDDAAFIQQLAEEFRTEVIEEGAAAITQDDISKIYDIFENSDITLSDLIKVLGAESLNRMKDLEY